MRVHRCSVGWDCLDAVVVALEVDVGADLDLDADVDVGFTVVLVVGADIDLCADVGVRLDAEIEVDTAVFGGTFLFLTTLIGVVNTVVSSSFLIVTSGITFCCTADVEVAILFAVLVTVSIIFVVVVVTDVVAT